MSGRSSTPGSRAPRAEGVQTPCSFYHVVAFVALSEVRPQENAAQVDVDSDIAPVQGADLYAEVSLKDLNGHGGLLLSDALESKQALLQDVCVRPIVPNSSGITIPGAHDPCGRCNDPGGHVVDEAMELGWPLKRRRHGIAIDSNPRGLEVAKSLFE
jgi:hypothetical protein